MRSHRDDMRLEKWRTFVERFSEAFKYGRQLTPRGDSGQPNRRKTISPKVDSDETSPLTGPRVIICSPHPDDECLTGALPLRLRKEANASVLNLVMTLGSAPGRKKERLQELTNACFIVDFSSLLVEEPLGFAALSLGERDDCPEEWLKKVKTIASHFQKFSPDLVCMPHCYDGHPTHQAVFLLVSEALLHYSRKVDRQVVVAESEFWRPSASPKLLIGLDDEDVSLLVAGTAEHTGEIIRNPYHLRQPARLMDNVRRGGELICGAGERPPDFCFGELYDLCLYEKGERKGWPGRKMIIPPGEAINLVGSVLG